jgi:hypothetical protein
MAQDFEDKQSTIKDRKTWIDLLISDLWCDFGDPIRAAMKAICAATRDLF